jgi:hypothetical protein
MKRQFCMSESELLKQCRPANEQHGSDEEQEQMLKLSTTECSTVSGDE